MNITTLRPDTLERVERAVENVTKLLLKATSALEAGNVPYAVIGGNAVAAWVSQIDEGAVRFTRDVDILLQRSDLEAAKVAMGAVGFLHAEVAGVDLFIDGPKGKPSQGVHLIFAGEKVKESDPAPAPSITEYYAGARYRVVSLEGLVRMKLVAWRLKDQVHLQDMIGVGLIDHTWPAKFPPELAARLQHVLDTPDG